LKEEKKSLTATLEKQALSLLRKVGNWFEWNQKKSPPHQLTVGICKHITDS
jgi:hypothetical protein